MKQTTKAPFLSRFQFARLLVQTQMDPSKRNIDSHSLMLGIGVVSAAMVAIMVMILTHEGVISTLDNDAYSYIDEAEWVWQHGLFGPVRPYTGNMPKPLLVLLYGLVYHLMGGAWVINALCAVVAGIAVGLTYVIGKRLHSIAAGTAGALLLLLQWPFFGSALTANSTLFLLVFALATLFCLITMEPGASRTRRILGLLFCAGFCRPEGWILYLFAVGLCLRQDTRAEKRPASRVLLWISGLAPLLAPLVDRALFGDWLYTVRSFTYFTRNFLPDKPPLAWGAALVPAYMATLTGLMGGVAVIVLIVTLSLLGAWTLFREQSSRPTVMVFLIVLPTYLLFNLNTFRSGFFPPRFILLPLSVVVLLAGVGVGEGWRRFRMEGRPPVSLITLASRSLGVGSIVACLFIGYQSLLLTRRGLKLEGITQRYVGMSATGCRSLTGRPVRILVANAYYNPLRFNLRGEAIVVDRILEDLKPAKSPNEQILRYHVLCLGTRNVRTEPLIDSARDQRERWRPQVVTSKVMDPLYLYLRLPVP